MNFVFKLGSYLTIYIQIFKNVKNFRSQGFHVRAIQLELVFIPILKKVLISLNHIANKRWS